jgi:hypothetical protein
MILPETSVKGYYQGRRGTQFASCAIAVLGSAGLLASEQPVTQHLTHSVVSGDEFCCDKMSSPVAPNAGILAIS